MRAALATVLIAASAGATTPLEIIRGHQGPLRPYTVTTEPGVTVKCGPSKVKKVPGDCAMFTVKPASGQPWTAWANEDAPDAVRTLQRGEVLVVGDQELRIYTRETRDKDSRTGALPPTAKLLSALEMSERDRLPPADQLRSVKELRSDGDAHFIAQVAQVEYADPERTRLAAHLEPVEVRVTIADGSMARVAAPQAPLLDGPRQPKCGMRGSVKAPEATITPDAIVPAPPPAPAERVLPEAPPVGRPVAPLGTPGPPPDRPTADPNFGRKGLKGYRAKGESSWGCSALPGAPALLALAALAARRRRRSAR